MVSFYQEEKVLGFAKTEKMEGSEREREVLKSVYGGLVGVKNEEENKQGVCAWQVWRALFFFPLGEESVGLGHFCVPSLTGNINIYLQIFFYL